MRVYLQYVCPLVLFEHFHCYASGSSRSHRTTCYKQKTIYVNRDYAHIDYLFKMYNITY